MPAGFGLMFVAGTVSGLLGIGSGAVKVLAMDQAMRIPFKVSTTTSNFMIGVTAAASAGVYLNRGYIDPGLAMPVMLGVLAGSLLGATVLGRARASALRADLRRGHRLARHGNDLQRPDGESYEYRGASHQPGWTTRKSSRASATCCGPACSRPRRSCCAGPWSTWRVMAADRPDYNVFRGEPPTCVHRRACYRMSFDFSGRGIIQLGFLLLIATPVARVIFAAVAFALERDMLYVGFTLLVLAVLLFGLFDPALR